MSTKKHISGKYSSCPFCGRRMVRESVARLSNPFCRHCRRDRIIASGGQVNAKNNKLIIDKNGYGVVVKG